MGDTGMRLAVEEKKPKRTAKGPKALACSMNTTTSGSAKK